MNYTIIRLSSVASTQDWVRTWAQMGASEGLVVQADEQRLGRGRLQRAWWSPPGGGLYLSLLFRPPFPLSQAQYLTMVTSLAAIAACRQVAGIYPQPKWPNDLVLNGKKLAGVLTELEVTPQGSWYAIIGLGLNVNTYFETSPLAETAVSLRQASGTEIDMTTLLAAFLREMEDGYTRLISGYSPVSKWKERLVPLGQRAMVRRHEQPPLHGFIRDVTPEGALLLVGDDGVTHTILAGDIIPDSIPQT